MHIALLEVIELRVRLHCKACEKAVRKALCKTKGIHFVHLNQFTLSVLATWLAFPVSI